MPLYEYQCRECGSAFETLVLGNEEVDCPKCQSVDLERLLSLPGAPKVAAGSLPMSCDSSLPPCSPTCCRL